MDFRRAFHISFLLLSVLWMNKAYSQLIPDSLLEKLNRATNDSVKTRALLDIGENIESRSPENSMMYYRQALGLAERISNSRLIFSSLINLGIGNMESNHFDTSLIYFNRAMSVAVVLRDTMRMGVVYSNLGNTWRYKKDNVKSLENYQLAAGLFEKINEKNRLPAIYLNICSFLSDNHDYHKAVGYGEKAFALASANGDDYTACNALINVSEAYFKLGEKEKQFDLLQNALVLAKRTNDLEEFTNIYNNLGYYYYSKNEALHALKYYRLSYGYAVQMGNHFHLCEACTRLAQIYQLLNKPDSALAFAKKAEAFAVEIGSRSNLKEILFTRAEIEHGQGHSDKGYEYLLQTLNLSDSLYTLGAGEKIAEMEARYESEKKQQQIAALQKDARIQFLSLKQKENFNLLLASIALMLLIVSFLSYLNLRRSRMLARQNEKIQQQRIVELEKDHELLIVHTLLKGQEEERGRMARDLHDGLGGLLSGVKFSMHHMKDNLIVTSQNMAVFERSLDLIDTSIAELRRIAHNMMPEGLVSYGLDEALKQYCSSINAGGQLQVNYQSVGLTERLPEVVEITSYRIIQELLNNILKHAFAKEATVQVIHGEDRLNIVVEDNGKGFDKNSAGEKKGAGWTNIRSRVDYLKGQMELNSEQGKGTLVNIEFALSNLTAEHAAQKTSDERL